MRGARGSKSVILAFRVPTISVGARDEGARGSKEVRGAKESEGMLHKVLGSPPHLWGQEVRGQRGVGGQRGTKGTKGREVYCIIGFRVPATSVGARGEEAMGSKGVRGAKESKACYTRF